MRYYTWYGILSSVGVLLVSCKKDEVRTSVPHRSVYIDIDLSAHSFRPLASPGSIQTITQASTAGVQLGYAGLAIIHTLAYTSEDRYRAYDLACPYDYYAGGRLFAQGLRLECQLCHSQYDVSFTYGIPISGVSTTPLKRYSCSYDATHHRLLVTN